MVVPEHSPTPGEESKPVVAMIHVGALPGTPRYRLPMDRIIAAAQAEARLYQDCGVNCLMIENMHDTPYLRGGVGPEIVASMTMVAQAVRAESKVPVGLQILAGADIEAMAVAHAANLVAQPNCANSRGASHRSADRGHRVGQVE